MNPRWLSHRGPDAQERGSLHRLPLENRSRAIRYESVAASPCMHITAPNARSVFGAREAGAHRITTSPMATRITRPHRVGRRCEVQPSNRRHAIGRNEAHYADDDGEEATSTLHVSRQPATAL